MKNPTQREFLNVCASQVYTVQGCSEFKTNKKGMGLILPSTRAHIKRYYLYTPQYTRAHARARKHTQITVLA